MCICMYFQKFYFLLYFICIHFIADLHFYTLEMISLIIIVSSSSSSIWYLLLLICFCTLILKAGFTCTVMEYWSGIATFPQSSSLDSVLLLRWMFCLRLFSQIKSKSSAKGLKEHNLSPSVRNSGSIIRRSCASKPPPGWLVKEQASVS